jgi:hypothetical protein
MDLLPNQSAVMQPSPDPPTRPLDLYVLYIQVLQMGEGVFLSSIFSTAILSFDIRSREDTTCGV